MLGRVYSVSATYYGGKIFKRRFRGFGDLVEFLNNAKSDEFKLCSENPVKKQAQCICTDSITIKTTYEG